MSLKHNDKNHERFNYIDSLRGLAALYVVLFHLVVIPKPSLVVSPIIAGLLNQGYSGVILFYVLSAFTLYNSMNLRKTELHPTIKFYIRRAFRIVPLYYVLLTVFLIWRGSQHIYFSGWQILSSFSFTFNFIPGFSEGIIWASWTLGVEMVFYLFFPVIFYFVRTERHASIFLLLSIIISGIFQKFALYLPLQQEHLENYIYFNVLRQIPAFAFGIYTYHIYEKHLSTKLHRKTWSLALCATAFIIYGIYVSGLLYPIVGYVYNISEINRIFNLHTVFSLHYPLIDELYIQALAYSCLLLGLATYPWPYLVNRFTVFLGTISYSLYLNHPIAIVVLMPYYKTIYSISMRPTLKYGICAVLTLAAVVLASLITYNLIEKPGMRLGTYIIKGKLTTHKENQVLR